jgi:hypothetical protein
MNQHEPVLYKFDCVAEPIAEGTLAEPRPMGRPRSADVGATLKSRPQGQEQLSQFPASPANGDVEQKIARLDQQIESLNAELASLRVLFDMHIKRPPEQS